MQFQKTTIRYLFAIATVAGAFVLRIWLVPFTGIGAPFVLFFAATLMTSLLVGTGPGICAVIFDVSRTRKMSRLAAVSMLSLRQAC
jgi:hypothetical protein